MSDSSLAMSPELTERLKVAKGRRRAPGDDPRIDTLMSMVMALTSEVSVLRERIDAHERLIPENKLTGPDAVDDYLPDENANAERARQRKRLIDKVCRPLLAEIVSDL